MFTSLEHLMTSRWRRAWVQQLLATIRIWEGLTQVLMHYEEKG